jgi:hypothetical protein
MIKEFVTRWPVIKQILNRADGTGVEAMSEHTLHMRPKNEGAGSGALGLPILCRGLRPRACSSAPLRFLCGT